MIAFAADLRKNGINLVVGMYPCGDHWHINALGVTPGREPAPLDVMLSTEKIDTQEECYERLSAIIQLFDPMHEPVKTLVMHPYTIDKDRGGQVYPTGFLPTKTKGYMD